MVVALYLIVVLRSSTCLVRYPSQVWLFYSSRDTQTRIHTKVSLADRTDRTDQTDQTDRTDRTDQTDQTNRLKLDHRHHYPNTDLNSRYLNPMLLVVIRPNYPRRAGQETDSYMGLQGTAPVGESRNQGIGESVGSGSGILGTDHRCRG